MAVSVHLGLMEKSSTIYPNAAESFLPGIFKELISSSIDFLGQSYDEEKTIADSLMDNLLKMYNGLVAISKAHEEQDEESQDNCKHSHCFYYLTLLLFSASYIVV
jgi:kinesin family protein 14